MENENENETSYKVAWLQTPKHSSGFINET